MNKYVLWSIITVVSVSTPFIIVIIISMLAEDENASCIFALKRPPHYYQDHINFTLSCGWYNTITPWRYCEICT